MRIKNWIVDELEFSLVLYYTGASRESAKIIDDQIKKIKEKDENSLNATHIVKQDALTMKEALLKGNVKLLAATMNHSWAAKKRMAVSISNKLIDSACEKAINAGAYSAKVSGAGGGGFIIFVVDPAKRRRVINELNSLGGNVVNFHFVKHGAKGWKIYE